MIPADSVSVIQDDPAPFVVDPLADVNPYGGPAAVVIGGHLYTALPGVQHLLMPTDPVVMESPQAGMLHHTEGEGGGGVEVIGILCGSS